MHQYGISLPSLDYSNNNNTSIPLFSNYSKHQRLKTEQFNRNNHNPLFLYYSKINNNSSNYQKTTIPYSNTSNSTSKNLSHRDFHKNAKIPIKNYKSYAGKNLRNAFFNKQLLYNNYNSINSNRIGKDLDIMKIQMSFDLLTHKINQIKNKVQDLHESSVKDDKYLLNKNKNLENSWCCDFFDINNNNNNYSYNKKINSIPKIQKLENHINSNTFNGYLNTEKNNINKFRTNNNYKIPQLNIFKKRKFESNKNALKYMLLNSSTSKNPTIPISNTTNNIYGNSFNSNLLNDMEKYNTINPNLNLLNNKIIERYTYKNLKNNEQQINKEKNNKNINNIEQRKEIRRNERKSIQKNALSFNSIRYGSYDKYFFDNKENINIYKNNNNAIIYNKNVNTDSYRKDKNEQIKNINKILNKNISNKQKEKNINIREKININNNREKMHKKRITNSNLNENKIKYNYNLKRFLKDKNNNNNNLKQLEINDEGINNFNYYVNKKGNIVQNNYINNNFNIDKNNIKRNKIKNNQITKNNNNTNNTIPSYEKKKEENKNLINNNINKNKTNKEENIKKFNEVRINLNNISIYNNSIKSNGLDINNNNYKRNESNNKQENYLIENENNKYNKMNNTNYEIKKEFLNFRNNYSKDDLLRNSDKLNLNYKEEGNSINNLKDENIFDQLIKEKEKDEDEETNKENKVKKDNKENQNLENGKTITYNNTSVNYNSDKKNKKKKKNFILKIIIYLRI